MRDITDFNFLLLNSWLIPALPFFSFFIVGLLIRPISAKAAGVVATLSILVACVLSYLLAWNYFGLFHSPEEAHALIPWTVKWLRYQENFTVNLGVLLDPISVLLLIVVTTVSLLVHLYSIGYMKGDEGYGRYFAFLNLFTFSMLGLVVAPNILQMYLCWELVGVSSFLLIGFYYSKPSAVAASKKAFIVTRFADLGFLIGILVLGYYGYSFFNQSVLPETAEPFDFLYLSSPGVLEKFAELPAAFFGLSVLSIAMVLVFMGAAGKSAMFPLHIWLPDAMEGPTPVSALIHAATMVVAGVYLIARLFPVFAAAPGALDVVAVVGGFTALFAAVIGCTQDDIKRVLAFSTLSQLGYMMFSLGVSSLEHVGGYTASMFHLFTHAFFKALLFLCAGSVIHAVHTNNIWEMGALRRKMPITHLTFLVATLAICGIYPFSGFFSKDAILLATLESGHTGFFVLGLGVAGLTAFYMCRIYFVTFFGLPRTEYAEQAHESPLIMLLPLCLLAVLSAAVGFLPFTAFVHPDPVLRALATSEHGGGATGAAHFWVPLLGTVVALIGMGVAALLYDFLPHERFQSFVRRLNPVRRVIQNKFYIDEVYLFVTRNVIFKRVATPIAWFDRNAVDGGVNLSAWLTRRAATMLRSFQTGQVQTYGAWLAGGVIVVLALLRATLKGGG